MRFSPDSRHLFVADAGAPHIHLYSDDGQGWWGVRQPVVSVRVLSEELYQRGRVNEMDGGTKGVDVSSDGKVLVVTSEPQPLAFYKVEEILAQVRPSRQACAAAVKAELVDHEDLGLAPAYVESVVS